MKKQLKLAYIAGVLDSDGYFTIKRSTYGWRKKLAKAPVFSERVGLKQVNPEAVQLIHRMFGGHYRIEKPSAVNGKPLHSLTLSNQKANKLVVSVLPYLILKLAQAKILIELRSELNQPKEGTDIIQKRNRWGDMSSFKTRCLSDEQIERRQKLFEAIKELNDTRNHSVFTPIPDPI